MKLSILPVFALLVLTSATAEAKYMPPPAWDLMLGSDVIATGAIVNVAKDTYRLKVSTVLHGATLPGTTITIKRRHDWPCAVRDAPYAKGQKLLVFLAKTDTQGVWRTRSAGFEAELFVQGDTALWTSHELQKLPKASFRVPTRKGKRKVSGRALSIQAMTSTLADVHRCHKIKLDRKDFFSRAEARVTCTPKEHKRLQKSLLYRELSQALVSK